MEEKKMGVFRFKNYNFRYNPNRFTVEQKRNLGEFSIPYQTAVLQDLGQKPMSISGDGELIGEDLMGEYQKLYELFLDRESGLLYLPDCTPVYCYFEELSVTGKAGPQVLSYHFCFREDAMKKSVPLRVQKNYYMAQKGDTLALIAVKCGVELELLKKLNPQVTDRLDIEEGALVWLS